MHIHMYADVADTYGKQLMTALFHSVTCSHQHHQMPLERPDHEVQQQRSARYHDHTFEPTRHHYSYANLTFNTPSNASVGP